MPSSPCDSQMTASFLAIINPAAGGGRCGRMAKDALAKLRAAKIEVEVAETTAPGQATALARGAYARGYRQRNCRLYICR